MMTIIIIIVTACHTLTRLRGDMNVVYMATMPTQVGNSLIFAVRCL